MKPSTLSSAAVPWYWGWLRLCGATAAGQAVFGEADWAKLSPSSNTPTQALNVPVRPCHLQPLILSHNPMSAGETGGERLGQTKRLRERSPHGTSSVLMRLETRQKDRIKWHTHMTQDNYSFEMKPTDWVTQKEFAAQFVTKWQQEDKQQFCKRHATMAFCKWEIEMLSLSLFSLWETKTLVCVSFTVLYFLSWRTEGVDI